MDIKDKKFRININGEDMLVDVKWFRGAGRYNNGTTLYKKKYLIRLVTARTKQNMLALNS